MPQMRVAAFGSAALTREGEGGRRAPSCSIHTHLVSVCLDAAENLFLLFRYVNVSPPTLGT